LSSKALFSLAFPASTSESCFSKDSLTSESSLLFEDSDRVTQTGPCDLLVWAPSCVHLSGLTSVQDWFLEAVLADLELNPFEIDQSLLPFEVDESVGEVRSSDLVYLPPAK